MSRNNLTLYQSASSPNSRRVRIYLAERGICVTTVPVDLQAGEQFSDAYAAINPRRVVPALALADGTVICEVLAIWRYLEEIIPDRPLLGTSPTEKALITMWERRMELEGFAVVMETVRNAAKSLAGRAIAGPHAYDQIPALVERGTLRIRDFYSDLEERLAGSPYVAGNQFSVADITALVTVDFAAQAAALAMPTDYSAAHRWYNSVSARASMMA